MDELIVKVIKAKKELNPLYSIRKFLVVNSFYFFYSNDKPKVLYIFYPKFIFFNINL